MIKFAEKDYVVMPHTKAEFIDDNNVRVYKTDSLEPDINTYLGLIDSSFHNGVIEVDVCADLLKDAPEYSRGFIGIVFRAKEDGSEFESFYIRPTNGKDCDDPVRKAHGCQYFSFPGYTFSYFRDFNISKYENSVDTTSLNTWSHIKAVIKDDRGIFYVDDIKVLEVNDLKHGKDARGNVGLYVDIGTDGYFKNFHIEYEE